MEDENHKTVRENRENGEIVISCSCRCIWSHQAGTSEEKIESIYQSHLAYFNKPKVIVL